MGVFPDLQVGNKQRARTPTLRSCVEIDPAPSVRYRWPRQAAGDMAMLAEYHGDRGKGPQRIPRRLDGEGRRILLLLVHSRCFGRRNGCDGVLSGTSPPTPMMKLPTAVATLPLKPMAAPKGAPKPAVAAVTASANTTRKTLFPRPPPPPATTLTNTFCPGNGFTCAQCSRGISSPSRKNVGVAMQDRVGLHDLKQAVESKASRYRDLFHAPESSGWGAAMTWRVPTWLSM